MKEKVLLVDEHDNVIGEEEKLSAHQKAMLHRAISVFIFNSSGDFLIQKRARSKYHSAGLWANTCCSHPRFGEDAILAARRRLKEEMGIEGVNLNELFSFIYKAELDHGLTENELDHVFFGIYDGEPVINKNEVETYKYVSYSFLKKDIKHHSEIYAEWFKILINEYGDILSRSSTKQ